MLGVTKYLVGPPTTIPPIDTFKALLDNLGGRFSVCNLISTQLDEI